MHVDSIVDDKDVIVNVTGVSISGNTGLTKNDSERDTREDKERSSDEEKPTGE
tara:strand:- start:74 stop:232 length:159 start_codon:yes stop_codon:yes gene_type:complete